MTVLLELKGDLPVFEVILEVRRVMVILRSDAAVDRLRFLLSTGFL